MGIGEDKKMAICIICGKEHWEWCPSGWAILAIVPPDKNSMTTIPLNTIVYDNATAGVCDECLKDNKYRTKMGNTGGIKVTFPKKPEIELQHDKTRFDVIGELIGNPETEE